MPTIPPNAVVMEAPQGERTPGGSMQYVYNAPLPAVPEDPVIPNLGPNRAPSPVPGPRGSTPGPMGPRMPTPVQAPPPVYDVTEHGPLFELLHTSSHPVNYNRKVYPTAYHLWEAFKFLGHRPDIAEQIRRTGQGPGGIKATRQIAHEQAEAMRLDWENVAIEFVCFLISVQFVR